MNLPVPPMLLITDRTMVRGTLTAALNRAFLGGCRWVMVREKDMSPDERMTLVESILRIAKPYEAKILVNSDMNAAEIGAAIAESGVDRKELFLADKISFPQSYSAAGVRKAFAASTNALRTTYLDLLMLHSVGPSVRDL